MDLVAMLVSSLIVRSCLMYDSPAVMVGDFCSEGDGKSERSERICQSGGARASLPEKAGLTQGNDNDWNGDENRLQLNFNL